MKKTLLSLAAFTVLVHAQDESLNNSFADAFSQSAFIPDISLIVDMSYVDRNLKDEEVAHLEVPGIAHGLIGGHSHGEHSHSTVNASNGFNLNYAELALHSSVDPYFDLDAVFHFSEHGVEIEEAYFTTNAIPYGFRIKGGKFLSEFGYLNNRHHHVWDFADMPLAYQAFLGGHGINEIGAQVQWLAPTSLYWMFGAEALQGENEQMYGTGAIAPAGDPETITVSSPDQPNLFVGYTKLSGDIGDTTLLGGLSIAYGDSRIDHLEDEESPHAFAGTSTLYGADLIVKHYFDSYSYLKWQSEWLYRDLDGTQYNYPLNDTTSFNTIAMRKKQAGYYTQLVYAYDQNWRIGGRLDSIYQNDVIAEDTNKNMPEDLNRYTAMIDYSTSEFARFRLQYNHNTALYNEEGEQQDVDSLIFQVNMAIGAHGAHSF